LPLAIKAYEQTFSVPWKAEASPQSAHPTVPLSEVLILFLNWNPRSFAKLTSCQEGSAGLVRIDLCWFSYFLSVSDPVTSFDSSLSPLQIP
jgi:hypothetical protein